MLQLRILFISSLLLLPVSLLGKTSLKNFGRVTKNIYRGARLTQEAQYQELSDREVKTVISLETTPLDDQSLCEKYGLRCLSFTLPLPHPRYGGDQNFDYDTLKLAFFRTENEASVHHRVYIHCRYGKDRTGALASLITLRAAYCPRTQDESPREYDADELWEKIYDDLIAYGFREEWYPNLLNQIREWVYSPPSWICDSE